MTATDYGHLLMRLQYLRGERPTEPRWGRLVLYLHARAARHDTAPVIPRAY